MLTKYISIVRSLDSSDVGKQILTLLANPSFNPTQSSHGRTLSRCLSKIHYFSLASDEGLDVMVETFVKIGKVNQMPACPLLQFFDHMDRFNDATKAKMFVTLERMQDSIDKKKEESLSNQLNIILEKKSSVLTAQRAYG
ncbi:uncharacterized protein KRP23_7019 [Phytophthora ramorum]|uniref:uncharacterized protein n=1 Tax=Phytophthora ramorum TaxID=164328 RepID=UPI0030A60592|nr:hypothetical protein KRP23_7019 [Phytophthora ramorum]